jgi:hypothetical protein
MTKYQVLARLIERNQRGQINLINQRGHKFNRSHALRGNAVRDAQRPVNKDHLLGN